MEKVKKYFDDSQITNITMIQTLMKQMTQRFQNSILGGQSLTNSENNFDMGSLAGINKFNQSEVSGHQNYSHGKM